MRINELQINLSLGSHNEKAPAYLSKREASLVLIATAVCKQMSDSKFQDRIDLALNSGCSLPVIKEAILQLAIYVGFPRVLQSMKAFHRITSELNPHLLDPTLQQLTHPKPKFNFFRQPHIQRALKEIDADFARMALINAVPLSDRRGLTAKERAIVIFISDIYTGVFDGPFQIHVEMAKQSGAVTDELKKAIQIGSVDLPEKSAETALKLLGAVQ